MTGIRIVKLSIGSCKVKAFAGGKLHETAELINKTLLVPVFERKKFTGKILLLTDFYHTGEVSYRTFIPAKNTPVAGLTNLLIFDDYLYSVMAPSILTGKKLQIFLHVAVWAFLFIFPTYLLYVDSSHDLFFIKRTFVQTTLYALLFYLNYLLLAPRLFFKKNKIAYFICSILLVVIATVIMELVPFSPSLQKEPIPREKMGGDLKINGDMRFEPRPDMEKPIPSKLFEDKNRPHPSRGWPTYNFLLTGLLISVLGLGIRFSDKLIQMEKQRKEAEKEKLNSELTFLKNQINPHFLFNTLNSIYSLALMKSDQTAEAVMKLSDMMHYVIYDIQGSKVPLEMDIQYIRHFVELQKIRLTDTTEVRLNMNGDFSQVQISPMILMVFVENAFKYGTSSHDKTMIRIDVSLLQNTLEFTITNQIFIGREKNVMSGIGLRNARQRLELEYPNKHKLTLTDNGKVFIVRLSIDLV